MPLLTYLLSLVVLSAAFATAHALEVPTPAPAVLAEQTGVQFKKLQHLLENLIASEKTYLAAIRRILDTYGDVEVANMYQGIDLTTSEGIRIARQRLNDFSAKNDGFTDANEQLWAEEQEQVRTADLAEPLASQLKDSLSDNQTDTNRAQRAWFTAMRAYTSVASRLLDVAGSHLGHLKWQNKRLTTADSRAAPELAAAQRAVSDAERRCNEMGWAASNRHDRVVEFVRSSMLELEKELRRREDR